MGQKVAPRVRGGLIIFLPHFRTVKMGEGQEGGRKHHTDLATDARITLAGRRDVGTQRRRNPRRGGFVRARGTCLMNAAQASRFRLEEQKPALTRFQTRARVGRLQPDCLARHIVIATIIPPPLSRRPTPTTANWPGPSRAVARNCRLRDNGHGGISMAAGSGIEPPADFRMS